MVRKGINGFEKIDKIQQLTGFALDRPWEAERSSWLGITGEWTVSFTKISIRGGPDGRERSSLFWTCEFWDDPCDIQVEAAVIVVIAGLELCGKLSKNIHVWVLRIGDIKAGRLPREQLCISYGIQVIVLSPYAQGMLSLCHRWKPKWVGSQAKARQSHY